MTYVRSRQWHFSTFADATIEFLLRLRVALRMTHIGIAVCCSTSSHKDIMGFYEISSSSWLAGVYRRASAIIVNSAHHGGLKAERGMYQRLSILLEALHRMEIRDEVRY